VTPATRIAPRRRFAVETELNRHHEFRAVRNAPRRGGDSVARIGWPRAAIAQAADGRTSRMRTKKTASSVDPATSRSTWRSPDGPPARETFSSLLV